MQFTNRTRFFRQVLVLTYKPQIEVLEAINFLSIINPFIVMSFTNYEIGFNYKKNNQSLANLSIQDLQIFDEETCNQLIEKIKSEIKSAREQAQIYEKSVAFHNHKYSSLFCHRLKTENPSFQNSPVEQVESEIE